MNKKLINWLSGSSFIDPRSLSNLLMWYDINDLTTITKDGSNRVSQVTDKSGNGYTVSNAGANTTWPVYTTNRQNGLPMLVYSATQILTGAKVTALQNLSGVTAFVVGGGGGAGAIYHGQDANNRILFTNDFNSGGRNLFAVVAKAGNTYGSVAVVAGNHKGSYVFDGSQTGNANRLKARVDGSAVTLSFTGTIPSTTEAGASSVLQLGESANTGKIGEVIVYTRVLSDSEILQVEAYLLSKWNL